MYIYGHLIWIGFLILISIIVFIIRARRAAALANALANKPPQSVVVIEPGPSTYVPMYPYQGPGPAVQHHPSFQPQPVAPYPQETPYIPPQQVPYPQQSPYIQAQPQPYPQQYPLLQQPPQQQQQPLQSNLQAAPFSPSILSPPPVYAAAAPASVSDAPYPMLQPAPPVSMIAGGPMDNSTAAKGSKSGSIDISKPWQPALFPSDDGTSVGTAPTSRPPQAPQTFH
ncbi:hypothetical protein FBU30_010117 [Linnemannia zychae]|nr:hypothetical protein FBU30_010117 [Linnemannia zychae]